jgi:hypothetical protein
MVMKPTLPSTQGSTCGHFSPVEEERPKLLSTESSRSSWETKRPIQISDFKRHPILITKSRLRITPILRNYSSLFLSKTSGPASGLLAEVFPGDWFIFNIRGDKRGKPGVDQTIKNRTPKTSAKRQQLTFLEMTVMAWSRRLHNFTHALLVSMLKRQNSPLVYLYDVPDF